MEVAADPLTHRAVQHGPRTVDTAVAIVLAVASLVQVLVLIPIAAPPVGVLVALWSTVPVAWRRTRPIEAAIVGATAWLVPTDGFLLLGYVATVLLFFAVGAYVASREAVLVTGVVGCLLSVGAAIEQDVAIGEYAGGLLAVVAPIVVGRVVRRERTRRLQLERLTVELERERERGARAAIAEERNRIARELHDVVAHEITAVAIQADAAEAALEHDPALARDPLRHIATSARSALRELRGLLGVLREPDGAPAAEPLPGLARLPDLVERARATGLRIRLDLQPPPRPPAPAVDLSLYRIVQEALTNARRHAGETDVEVRVACEGAGVVVEVRDSGVIGPPPPPAAAGDGDGRGLVGMRERARLHGGTLQAGPRAGGGFEVRATLPLGELP